MTEDADKSDGTIFNLTLRKHRPTFNPQVIIHTQEPAGPFEGSGWTFFKGYLVPYVAIAVISYRYYPA